MSLAFGMSRCVKFLNDTTYHGSTSAKKSSLTDGKTGRKAKMQQIFQAVCFQGEPLIES